MKIQVERILDLMNKRKIKAKTLAEEINVPASSITGWKKGDYEPSIDALIKISVYFEVSLDYLVGLTDNPTQPKKEFTSEDKLKVEISNLTTDKKERAIEFVEFLKTREEFAQELSDITSTAVQKPSIG